MIVRNINEDELDQVAEVAYKAMNPVYGEMSLEKNKGIAEKAYKMCDKRISFVAEENGKVVGFSFSRIQREPWAEFPYGMTLAVLPEYQHRGIGTALLQKTVETLKQLGWNKFKFHVLPDNKPALSLYKKLGFKTEKYLMGKRF